MICFDYMVESLEISTNAAPYGVYGSGQPIWWEKWLYNCTPDISSIPYYKQYHLRAERSHSQHYDKATVMHIVYFNMSTLTKCGTNEESVEFCGQWY